MIDQNGQQRGIVSLREALDIARSVGLDLIEVAGNAEPVVCRIMDYGKFKYEEGKRDREAHKKRRMTEIKTIRMRPSIDEHDFEFKAKNALKFLGDGHKVKAVVIFRSREITHPEFARESLSKLAEMAKESGVGKVERAPMFEGRTMTLFLSPTGEPT